MTTIFLPVQIQDALLKLEIYFAHITGRHSNEKCEKLCRLAMEIFLKFGDNQQFASKVYELVKAQVQTKKNYYMLLLLDQLLKNNKHLVRRVRKELQGLFKPVWEAVWHQSNNKDKIESMMVMVKIWGIIYGQKYEQPIRKWIDLRFNMKFTSILPEHQEQIRTVYDLRDNRKKDTDYQQLIKTIEPTREHEKKGESIGHCLNLYEQLEIDL